MPVGSVSPESTYIEQNVCIFIVPFLRFMHYPKSRDFQKQKPNDLFKKIDISTLEFSIEIALFNHLKRIY